VNRLSELVDESLAEELARAIEQNQFPGVGYRQAMEFLLSDGIVPEADLPVASVLKLEDWARLRGARQH
jgi:hypothetical protein